MDLSVLFLGVVVLEGHEPGVSDLALEQVVAVDGICEQLRHEFFLVGVFVLLDRLELFLLFVHEDYLVVLGLKVPLGVALLAGAYSQEETVVGGFELAYAVDHPRLVIVVRHERFVVGYLNRGSQIPASGCSTGSCSAAACPTFAARLIPSGTSCPLCARREESKSQ